MTTTTISDEQTRSAMLDELAKLRQAIVIHRDAESRKGRFRTSTERTKLARAARRIQQRVTADAGGRLMQCLEIYANVGAWFVPEFAECALTAITDFERWLRDSLDNALLTFPITATALTRLAGLKSVTSVTQQIDRAIDKDRQKRGEQSLAKRGRGKIAVYREPALRGAYPYLREGSTLKEFFISAYENK